MIFSSEKALFMLVVRAKLTNISGKPSTYVEVSVDGQACQKTNTVPRSKNPLWNYTLTM